MKVKKVLAILLVLTMMFSLAAPTFADDPVFATKVAIEEESVELVVGKSYTLDFTVKPNNASNVVWTSDDTNVATVSNGVIAALAQGTTTITLKAQSSAGYMEASVEVVVLPENCVAKVVDAEGVTTGYTVLSAAIADAYAEGATLYLMADAKDITVEDALTLDLNGYKLTGTCEGSDNVTIKNTGKTMGTLAVEGTFANTLKGDGYNYLADGYDAFEATANSGIFNKSMTIDDIDYVIDIDTTANLNLPESGSIGPDRDNTNDGEDKDDGKKDVYMDDTVTVDVYVEGARFFGANVTLTWDNTLFKDVTPAATAQSFGWTKHTTGSGESAVVSYQFVNSHDASGSHYYELDEKGRYHLGSFTVKALPISEERATSGNNECTFEIKDATLTRTWAESSATSAYEVTGDNNLKTDFARILLQPGMLANVVGRTGLVYSADSRELVTDVASVDTSKKPTSLAATFSATGNGKTVAGATIGYCVKTATEAEGVDPAELTYTAALPEETNAGDYVVFYKVQANGFASVLGNVPVTIEKKGVNLTWIAPTYKTTGLDKTFGTNDTGFEGEFDVGGFNAPTASYVDVNNNTQTNVNISKTAGPDEIEHIMKTVGDYTFTAVDPTGNYYFLDGSENTSVKVVGKKFTGITLLASGNDGTDLTWNAGNVGVSGNSADGKMWRDGDQHAIAALTVFADKAAEATNTLEKYKDLSNFSAVYSYYNSNDPTCTASDGTEVFKPILTEEALAALKFDAVGTYKLKVVLNADNYEQFEQTVTFEIANPSFVYEIKEYVAGWSLVLAYTNESVTFNYKIGDVKNAMFKYDDTMKYHYGSEAIDANNLPTGGTTYTNVYGIVVEGRADANNILASNAEAPDLKRPTTPNRLDVNDISTDEGTVNVNDLSKVQGIYNNQRADLTNETGNTYFMEMLLRADINRDKKVDVNGDAALIQQKLLEN